MPAKRFDLHVLGWSEFQSLCLTIAREILGQTAAQYEDVNDEGCDGIFTGTWKTEGGETYQGEFVIQAKHTTDPNTTLGPAVFEAELDNAERLAEAGLCDVYLLMTNAKITFRTARKLKKGLAERGINQSKILGPKWINGIIFENPRLRTMVPRLYGLCDLSEILSRQAYEQAQAVLDMMRTNLDKLVRTQTYEKARNALHKSGFVLLSGQPATGKTTIAAELALASADAHNTQVVILEEASQFPDKLDVAEPQFFWLDDAFGATQFDRQLARDWQRITPKVLTAINLGSKFVLTSRDYILQAALPHLKEGSFPLLQEAEVVVDVADLTPRERRHILYNHLKHGRQPVDYVRQLKPLLEDIADHPGFTPELARRLADPAFTAQLEYPTAWSLSAFFDSPRQFLADTFASLDTESFAALGLIFLSRGRLPSPIELTDNQRELLSRLGGTLGGATAALGQMNGSLVKHVTLDQQQGWDFAHPTMSEAYADRLRNPEFFHLLVEGFGTDALLEQTTCGDVGRQNAIVLPESAWPSVMDRLDELFSRTELSWWLRSRRATYLADRCAPGFQAAYLERRPQLLDDLSEPGLMLDADPDNDLVISLHGNGILPEATRAIFAAHLIEFCVDGTDGSVLWDEPLRGLLTPTEDDLLRDLLLREVIPNPRSVVDMFVQCAVDDDPEGSTVPLEEFAEALEQEFPDNPSAKAAADKVREARWDWINDQPWHEHEEASPEQFQWPEPAEELNPTGRSIFEDLVPDHP